MRLVNPIGREVGTQMEASYDLRACMCHSGFTGEQGAHDNCAHCGCDTAGNSTVADGVDRAS